jgi:hypothetical protein
MNPKNKILNKHLPDNQHRTTKTDSHQEDIVDLWFKRSDAGINKDKPIQPKNLTDNNLWDSTWLKEENPKLWAERIEEHKRRKLTTR